MWREALVCYQLLTIIGVTLEDVSVATGIAPQDCTLECVQKGGSGCEYCRISRADVERSLGFRSIEAFGSCIPMPCFELLGKEDLEICQHYVHAPNDVTVEFVPNQESNTDTIIVSWKPSYYGIAFLRGFQVSLQALGGMQMACQLFLFQRNLSLPASHAQRVYMSDPFPGLTLRAQYAATVMALPVPERWDRFYHSKIFSTRSCAEKNGLKKCKKEWYPEYVEVQQNGTDVIVTFNLAPPNLGIRSYFSWCYGKDLKKYMDVIPNSNRNTTHYSYYLLGLQEGNNYTCEIAAHEVDAVRKRFSVQVKHRKPDTTSPLSAHPSSVLIILLISLALVFMLAVLLGILSRRRTKHWMKTVDIQPDIIEQHQDRTTTPEEVTSLPSSRLTPPRLLICYSSRDGPAHVRAVMHLGAFLQQHMATKVCLDLWDSLSLAEEGAMGWYYRQIQESDFILVICSRSLKHWPVKPPSQSEGGDEEEEMGWWSNASSSAAAVALIGEEMGRKKAQGEDLSRYMAAIFEYSEETDIPAELGLVTRYTLTRDLPLLFSHLHGVALHRPGGYLKIEHISEEGFSKLPAGTALQQAIREAGMVLLSEIEQCNA